MFIQSGEVTIGLEPTSIDYTSCAACQRRLNLIGETLKPNDRLSSPKLPSMVNEVASETQPGSASLAPTFDSHILTAAKGSGITFFGTLFEYAGRFVLGFLLARLLGAEQYGLFSLADSATAMAAGIALLGLDIGIVYFVPIFVTRRDEASLWSTLKIGLGLPLGVSLLSGACLFGLANFLAEAVFHAPALAPLLRIVAFVVPCVALTSVAVSVTRGFKLMHLKVIALDITSTLVKLFLMILLAITGLNAIKAVTAYSLSAVVSCTMMIYFVYRLRPLNRPRGPSALNLKRMLSYSLPVYVTQLLVLFGPSLRIMLLGAMSTMISVGIYTVAVRITMMGTAFFSSVAVATAPIVSELFSGGKRSELGRFYQTVTKWTFTFNLPLFLLILIFSQSILSIFGPSFVAGSLVLIILAGGDLVNAATGNSSTMITMTGNTWLNTGNSVMTLVLTLTLSALLIPSLDMLGAAIATAAGVIVINLVQVLEIFLLFRIVPYNRSFLKPVLAGLLSALVAYAIVHWFPALAGPVNTVLGMGALLATYAGTIVLLGLSAEDQMILKRLVGRLRRGGRSSDRN